VRRRRIHVRMIVELMRLHLAIRRKCRRLHAICATWCGSTGTAADAVRNCSALAANGSPGIVGDGTLCATSGTLNNAAERTRHIEAGDKRSSMGSLKTAFGVPDIWRNHITAAPRFHPPFASHEPRSIDLDNLLPSAWRLAYQLTSYSDTDSPCSVCSNLTSPFAAAT